MDRRMLRRVGSRDSLGSDSSGGVFHVENMHAHSHPQHHMPLHAPLLARQSSNGGGSYHERSRTPGQSSSASSGSNSEENRVKVVVRIRPPIQEDFENPLAGEYQDCTTTLEDGRTLLLSRPTYDDRDFTVDCVLGPMSSQRDTYDVVASEIVEDVLRGYNGTILAYGQTGSGKTYSIFGPGTDWESGVSRFSDFERRSKWSLEEEHGVIPRAVHQIFDHIDALSDDIEFRVTVSFLQIYVENVMDLFDSSKTNLHIREDPKTGVYVDNLTQVVVTSPEDVLEIIKLGASSRAIYGTSMNKLSSRSHVILMITVEQRPYEGSQLDAKQEQRVKRGLLTLVDLAGSERVSKSGSEGQRLEEAKTINKSLSALGNCVASLIDASCTHVPFRDSKLTRLLTDSLGGNSKTCLIANIGPALFNYEESYSTLLFATRAMAVKNHAVVNEVVDFKTLSESYQRRLSAMETEKSELLARNTDLERRVMLLQSELAEAQNRSYTTDGSSVDADGSFTGNRRSSGGETAATAGYYVTPNSGPMPPGWEEREKELIRRFSSVIQRLQYDIARREMELQERMKGAPSSSQQEQVVDQLVEALMSIPMVREKIVRRVVQEAQVLDQTRHEDRAGRDGGRGAPPPPPRSQTQEVYGFGGTPLESRARAPDMHMTRLGGEEEVEEDVVDEDYLGEDGDY